MRRGRWRSRAGMRERGGIDVETMWTDDGFVVRFPETDEPPDPRCCCPLADEVEALVLRQLGGTSLFAAQFREAAGARPAAAAATARRPRRRCGSSASAPPTCSPWRREFGSFPMLLETYRECLRDVFDLPALIDDAARDRASAGSRGRPSTSTTPSPFAASLLFGYVANYHLRRRRAAGRAPRAGARRSIRRSSRELLGDAELRELLDRDAIDERRSASCSTSSPSASARSADGIHDLLLRLGDLTAAEIDARSRDRAAVTDAMRDAGRGVAARACALPIAGERALRRGRGCQPLPRRARRAAAAGPAAMRCSSRSRDPLRRIWRCATPARTGRSRPASVARRYGLGRGTSSRRRCAALAAAGRLLEGEFRPGGTDREWCDPGVLGQIRRRSLARLRQQVEPVEPARPRPARHDVAGRRRAAARASTRCSTRSRRLQGAPLVASLLETEILPARVEGYDPGDLDTLLAAGEVVWCGVEPLGERDGRLALYLTDAPGAAVAAARPPSRALGARGAGDRSTTSQRRAARRSSRRSTRRSAAASRRDRRRAVGASSGAAS